MFPALLLVTMPSYYYFLTMFSLKAFVYSVFSPAFYKEAVEKRTTKRAFLTFLLFIGVITFFVSGYVFVTSLPVFFSDNDIDRFNLTLYQGELEIEGLEMPFETIEGRQYLAIDTTGVITEIPDEYLEGFVVREDGIVVRNADFPDDQIVDYATMFPSSETTPITFDDRDLNAFLKTFVVIYIVVAPFVIFFWNLIWKLLVVLLVSGIGSLFLQRMGRKEAFRDAYVIALYASIPMFYTSVILQLFDALSLELFSGTVGMVCCLVPFGIWVLRWSGFFALGASGLKKKG